ncbi:TetR/AcrR family transcriptional regulator [Bauldia sp.]|uniref:TetR/AcrR family transcriptional regulator n=1 Tax=Bauldia sp. TaxID=2575872 RepID=UPI003BAB9E40
MAAATTDQAPVGVAPPDANRHRPYHHGDLRASLLQAAEQELAEKGIEGFTLRGCARRASVSHAAPAHHFRDVRALLTEIARTGFERLSATMSAHESGIPIGSIDYLIAVGRGYVAFAIANPQLFRLLFQKNRLNTKDEGFRSAGNDAFDHPVRAVGAYYNSDARMSDPDLANQVIGMWSLVHGLAELLLTTQLANRFDATGKEIADRLVPATIRQFFLGPEASASR